MSNSTHDVQLRLAAVNGTLPPSLQLPPRLLSLRIGALWDALKRQPFSVWAVIAYLFFEYVRPQTIYPSLNVVPWARIALISSTVSMLVQSASVRRWTILDTGMVIFTMVLLASCVTATYPERSWESIDLYLSWVLVYAFISTNINTQSRIILLLLGWFLWNLKMTQHGFRSWAEAGFSFKTFGVTGAPGWFQNSGEFGIQTTVILPISLYFALGMRPFVSNRVFLILLVLPVTALGSAIASSSRGAVLGMVAIGLWMLLRSRYKLRAGLGLILVGGVVWLVLPDEQKARFSTAGEDDTSTLRLTYWKRGIELANEHPVLGIGYKNWLPMYQKRWGWELDAFQRVELPHNFFVEAWSEMGYLGLGALLFLIAGSFFLNSRTRALARKLGDQGYLAEQLGWGFDGALIGYMVSGFFVTVLYYPFLWVNLGMTAALHLSVARTLRATRRAMSHTSSVPIGRAEAAPTRSAYV